MTIEIDVKHDTGTWQGKPVWIGAVDTRDGTIIEAYSYHETDRGRQHHANWMSSETVNLMKNETYVKFWIVNNSIQTRRGITEEKFGTYMKQQLGLI